MVLLKKILDLKCNLFKFFNTFDINPNHYSTYLQYLYIYYTNAMCYLYTCV